MNLTVGPLEPLPEAGRAEVRPDPHRRALAGPQLPVPLGVGVARSHLPEGHRERVAPPRRQEWRPAGRSPGPQRPGQQGSRPGPTGWRGGAGGADTARWSVRRRHDGDEREKPLRRDS